MRAIGHNDAGSCRSSRAIPVIVCCFCLSLVGIASVALQSEDVLSLNPTLGTIFQVDRNKSDTPPSDTEAGAPLSELHWNVLPSDRVQFLPAGHCEARFQLHSEGNFTCGDASVSPGSVCSGLIMKNGNCFLHNNGTYHYFQGKQEEEERLPYCTAVDTTTTPFNMTQYGTLSSPNCAWTKMDPKSLFSLFPDQAQTRVLMIGASHTRNIFSGIVSAIRGLRNVFDLHPTDQEKRTNVLFQYQVWENRDQLDFHLGQDRIEMVVSSTANRSSTVREKSIEIWFFWAPSFADQTKAFNMLMPALRPHLLINAIVRGHEPRVDMNEAWRTTLLNVTKENPPSMYAWVDWYYGPPVGDRKEKLSAMFLDIARNNVTVAHKVAYDPMIEAAKRFNLTGVTQLATTWHSACGIFPNNLVLKEGWCPDPFDRAYGSIFFTLLHDAIRKL